MEEMKTRLSTLWVFVMFNMIFADILSFMYPGFLAGIMAGTGQIQITQELLLIFAVLLEIPIAMIVLSRVLKYRANRWANIIAAVITSLFVIGGGSSYFHYLFFATLEVLCMAVIVWNAWRWSSPEDSPARYKESKLGM